MPVAPFGQLLVIVAAMVVGGLWAAIAGVLKVTRGVSEVLSTIMLNAIATGIIAYLLNDKRLAEVRPGSNNVATPQIPESGRVGPLNGFLSSLGLDLPGNVYGLLPLAIVWFGAGELTKVILIGYGCFWVMLSNVIAGVKYVDPALIRAARSFRVSGWTLYREVVLPAALPRMFAGARVALGVGFMVIVGAEMIGTIQGLGALIMEARSFYRSEITVIGMLVIGVLGFLISSGLAALERLLLPWGGGSSEALQ